jgi:O-antigen/teichoic acid export membrane protein
MGKPWVAVTAAWRQHRDVLSNTTSLVGTTGVTAALGFLYWAVAARLFSQQAVGYGSAAVSAMIVLGTIGMLGLNTVLIGELPRRTRSRAGLVSAALVASAIGSLLLGLAFCLVAPHFSKRFADMVGTPLRAAVFTAGVVVTAVVLVFDQATIGLLRGGLQLSRNVIFSVVKILLLPATVLVLHDAFGVGIALAWVAGMVVSLVPIAIRLTLSGTPVLPRPDWGVLRGLSGTALAHFWLNLAIGVRTALIPVLVTIAVSPSAGAAFYVAWMLAGFLYIVPQHLSTVLFAVAAADPAAIPQKVRFTLKVSLLIGLPGMALLILAGRPILSLFGAGYVKSAALPLLLLVLGYLLAIPQAHYIAVCRAQGKIPRCATVMTIAAAFEIAAAVAGGVAGGLVGLSFALLGVRILECLVTAPPVFRAAARTGRHRLTRSRATAAGNPASPVPADERKGISRWRGPASSREP